MALHLFVVYYCVKLWRFVVLQAFQSDESDRVTGVKMFTTTYKVKQSQYNRL